MERLSRFCPKQFCFLWHKKNTLPNLEDCAEICLANLRHKKSPSTEFDMGMCFAFFDTKNAINRFGRFCWHLFSAPLKQDPINKVWRLWCIQFRKAFTPEGSSNTSSLSFVSLQIHSFDSQKPCDFEPQIDNKCRCTENWKFLKKPWRRRNTTET